MPATNRIVFAESCQVGAKIRDTSLSVSVCTDKPPWSTPIDTLRHMQPDQVLTFKVGAICRLYLWSSDQAAGLFPIDLRAPKLHGEAVDCGEAEVKSVRVRCLDALYAPDENGLEHRFDFTLEIAGRVNLDVLVAEPANDAFMGAVLAERRRIWALLTGKSFVAATLDYVSNERMSVQQLSLPLSDIVMRMPGAPATPTAPAPETEVEPAPAPAHDADGVVLDEGDASPRGPLLLGYEASAPADRVGAWLDELETLLRDFNAPDHVANFGVVAQWAGIDGQGLQASDDLIARIQTDERFVVDGRVGEGLLVGLADVGLGRWSVEATDHADRMAIWIDNHSDDGPPTIQDLSGVFALPCAAVHAIVLAWPEAFVVESQRPGWDGCIVETSDDEFSIALRMVPGYAYAVARAQVEDLEAKAWASAPPADELLEAAERIAAARVAEAAAEPTPAAQSPTSDVPSLTAEQLAQVVRLVEHEMGGVSVDQVAAFDWWPPAPPRCRKRDWTVAIMTAAGSPDLVLDLPQDRPERQNTGAPRLDLSPAAERRLLVQTMDVVEATFAGRPNVWRASLQSALATAPSGAVWSISPYGKALSLISNTAAMVLVKRLVEAGVVRHPDADGFGPIELVVHGEAAVELLQPSVAPASSPDVVVHDADGVVLETPDLAGSTDLSLPAQADICDAVLSVLKEGRRSDWVASFTYTIPAASRLDVEQLQLMLAIDGRFDVSNLGTFAKPQWLVALKD